MSENRDTFRVTHPYDVLIRGSTTTPVGIFQLQTTTAEQLTRLHYSRGSIKFVKAKLKVLTEQGFLHRDPYPVKDDAGIYHNLSCYTLNNRGMAHLRSLRIDTHDAWRAAKEGDKSWPWLRHALEVNDVIISAALLPKVTADFWLHRFELERVFRRNVYRPSWQENGITYQAKIIPDALLEFRARAQGKERSWTLLLEHDRDSEKQTAFRRKIRGYAIMLRSKSDRQLYATTISTVAFTTFAGMNHIEEMRRWTRDELRSDPPEIAAVFCFAALEKPPEPSCWFEPIWYTVFDSTAPEALLAA